VASQESYGTRKLLEDINSRLLKTVDIDGDGNNETIVAKGGFVRAVTFSQDGTMNVKKQWSAKKANASIADYAFGDFDGNGFLDVCLLDEANGMLVSHFQNNEGIFEEKKELEIKYGNFKRLFSCNMPQAKNKILMLISNDGLGTLSVASSKQAFKSVLHQKTDIEEGHYSEVYCGKIIPDKFDEIIALEDTKHIFEFFKAAADKEPERFYKFKVFEREGEAIASARGYYGRRTIAEPREVVFADINSDGLNDLALLAHNRIVIFEQKQ